MAADDTATGCIYVVGSLDAFTVVACRVQRECI